jgi:hypothetical protein
MNVTQVFVGSTLDILEDIPEFEADAATPFPLEDVYERLYACSIRSDEITRNSDVLEYAVLFQELFGESVGLEQLQGVEERVEVRVADDDDDTPRRGIVVEEVVNAYGRNYAFTTSSFRVQYDALKWHGVRALDEIGERTIALSGALVERTKSLRDRVTEYWMEREDDGAEDTSGTGTRVFAPLRERVTRLRQ